MTDEFEDDLIIAFVKECIIHTKTDQMMPYLEAKALADEVWAKHIANTLSDSVRQQIWNDVHYARIMLDMLDRNGFEVVAKCT